MSSLNSLLHQTSAEHIAELVGDLGAEYQVYKEEIVGKGLSGEMIELFTEAELAGFLSSEIGITNVLHMEQLLQLFSQLKLPSTTDENVTKTPRFIMGKVFKIQGISIIDPSDIHCINQCVTLIEKTIDKSYRTDGVNTFHCFISYRVSADSNLALNLYHALKLKGIYAFWDKACLKNGEDWKIGFLRGIHCSHKFLALMSRAGLEKDRDPYQDHTKDNVLLEYEIALKLKEKYGRSDFILPIHIGEGVRDGVLTKFNEFNPTLYPDTLISYEAIDCKLANELRLKQASDVSDDVLDRMYACRSSSNSIDQLVMYAKNGYFVAQGYVAILMVSGGNVNPDYFLAEEYAKIALPLILRSNNHGKFTKYAQFILGKFAHLGLGGIEKNPEIAFKYLKFAADEGHADAQNDLGSMYANGEGVAKNAEEACKYYRLAADQGHAFGQYNLGRIYESGTGVTKNLEEARRYYKLAADQDHTYAKANLFNESQQRSINVNINVLPPRSNWFRDFLETTCVTIGNSIGSFIPWTCPKCRQSSKINEYGGNVVTGNVICPKCGKDING
eukprot:gene13759-18452_t